MIALTRKRKNVEASLQRSYDLAKVSTAAASDVGRIRSQNQDAYCECRDAATGRRLLMVADGMGGHQGGEVASEMAVQCASRIFRQAADTDPEELLGRALSEANRVIFERAAGDSNLAGMGTTAVAILLDGGDEALLAHVGDSRAYRIRAGALCQLTVDHSIVSDLIQRGVLSPKEALKHPRRHVILRSLGTRPTVRVEFTHADAKPGDRFLLCSDGLSNMLSGEQISAALAEGSASQVAEHLVELANEAGGRDNVTAQVAILPPP